MIKRKRELIQLAQREGLLDVAVVPTNGCHYRIEATYLGRPVKVVTSFSPSDYRTSLNVRSYLRQAMRAIESHTVHRQAKPA